MVATATEPGAVAAGCQGRLGSSIRAVGGIDADRGATLGPDAAKGRYRDPVRSKDDQVMMTPGLQVGEPDG